MIRTPAPLAALALLLALQLSGCTSPQSSATVPSSTGATGVSAAAGDTTATALGKVIFDTGKDGDGQPIGASAGNPGPCAQCHGSDAKGKVGPDIRWSVLAQGASSQHAPRFPLADEAAFAKAVTAGDAAGNQLRPMMPRFQLTAEQVSALVAYLKTL
jgi:mono/diheme cytochrome c family protein